MSQARTRLDDQIEAAEMALAYFRRLGRCRSRKDKAVARLIDLAMGQELILRNLRFQKDNEAAFRGLARDLITARQDAAVNELLNAFPGSTITELNIEELAPE